MEIGNRTAWALLDVIGMAVLIIGAVGYIGLVDLGSTLSLALLIAGIAVIIASAIFIHIEGSALGSEIDEYHRVETIREEAAKIPNDLREGYIVDFTADPENAISYSETEEPGCACPEET